MDIEREVAAIDCEVIIDCQFEFSERRAGMALEAGPEKAMMNNEEVGTGAYGLADGAFGSVDGGGHAGDFAVVGELETVEGIGVVFDGLGGEFEIHPGDEFIQEV